MTDDASPTPSLPDRMRTLADFDRLPADHELRTLADAMDNAVAGYFATPQIVKVPGYVGAWARARRAWCNYTGETLI